MQPAAVRPAVDDVERALEHAEERQRRPEQERTADDAECRRVRLDRRAPRAGSSRPTCSGTSSSSSRTKNEPSSAWCTSPSSASARKSSGTNERSAKYAIIAARCVPRSAKNLLTTRLTARQYARRDGRGPGDRGSDRDLAAGPRRRDHRRRRRDPRLERAAGCAERLAAARRRARRGGRAPAAAASRSSRRRPSTAASSSCATASALIAATTTPEPTVGLVFYDLKTCLRSVERGRRRKSAAHPPRSRPARADDAAS